VDGVPLDVGGAADGQQFAPLQGPQRSAIKLSKWELLDLEEANSAKKRRT
jgi:hypothetical protein